MSRSTTKIPTSRHGSCCPVPHLPAAEGAQRASPALTRRELLMAFAATPLVGCSSDDIAAPAISTSPSSQPPTSADPAWISAVPTVSFSEGASLAYDLRQHARDFDPLRHEMALAADSAALPASVTLDPTGWLRYDGSKTGAQVSGIVIVINERTGGGGGAGVSSGSQGALATFAARIASPGVVRHFAFDSPAHLGAGPGGFGYGHNYGWYDDGIPGDHPVHDSSMSPSGAGGSLRFELDATRGGGAWSGNFSNDLQTRFNAGDEFFVQWRQRFNAAMIGPNVGVVGAWKQCIISSGDVNYTVGGIANSCRCAEICLTSYEYQLSDDGINDRFPIAYHRCPDCGGTLNLTQPDAGQFLLLQNMMPAPYCGYNNVHNNRNGTNLPAGNCWTYVADEWLTFQIGVTCGNRVGNTLVNSRIRIWAQRQGQASVPLIDTAGPGGKPFTLTVPATDPGYGKFWFTCRNPYPRNTTMRTWVSELIISTKRIPDAL